MASSAGWGPEPGWGVDRETLELRPPDDYDPDPRVPASEWEHRRIAATDGRPGMVIVYVSLAFLIAIIVGCLISLATSRSGPDPTAPSPTDMAGLARVSTSAASASGPSQSGAPQASAPPRVALSSLAGGAPQTTRRGVASWYCCTRGYTGTAVVAIPHGRYVPRGHEPYAWVTVTVFVDGRSVSGTFPAVDYCACGSRHGKATVVDLSIEAVRELGLDPGTGIWPTQVTVNRFGRIPVAPATDIR